MHRVKRVRERKKVALTWYSDSCMLSKTGGTWERWGCGHEFHFGRVEVAIAIRRSRGDVKRSYPGSGVWKRNLSWRCTGGLLAHG